MKHLGRHYAEERKERGTQVSARQLYTEAERILARTAGGLSLYERLLRDPELRADIMDLLADMESQKRSPLDAKQFQPKRRREKPEQSEQKKMDIDT